MVATGRWTFAGLLRRLRESAALSQEELAVRAGLSRRGISDLERGLRRAPHPDTVRRLAEALGLGDGERAQLLAASRRREGGQLGVEAPDSASAPIVVFSLPVPPSTFVGREREVREVAQLLDATRLLTLTGTGGVGKTRLALEAARVRATHHVQGAVQQAFVDLSKITEPDLVSHEIAAALRIVDPPGRPVLESLLDVLHSRAALLVLDNCEHVIGAVATVVDFLLPKCLDLRILATSREPLSVPGEVVWRVPSLSLPRDGSPDELVASEAAQLFVERARAMTPRFAITDDNASAVVDVCRRLDGIPLAIELAAARISALGVVQIARRLDERFVLLSRGSRTAPARHQTLWAALDWSYQLLADDERRLFEGLPIFAGGWTLEAAEAVCAGDGLDPGRVLDLLAQLVDKSLVQVDDMPDGQVRYRLLETIRQYASERLIERGDADLVRERHRTWCLVLAEKSEREIWRAEQLACVERLKREHDNLRAALGWTLDSGEDPEPGLRLAAALARFWHFTDDVREGTMWLDRLLALPTVQTQTLSWARAMTALGYLRAMGQDAVQAARLIDECLPFWQALGDPAGLAVALFFRGVAVGWPEPDQSAVPYFEKSLVLSRVRGPRWTTYNCLFALGEAARVRGEFALAEDMLTESLSLAQDAGDRFGAGLSFAGLSLLRLNQGQTEPARELATNALKQSLELGNTLSSTVALEILACVAAAGGHAARAVRLFGSAHTLRAPIGDFAHSTERGDRERGITAARAQLDTTTFADEWAMGQTMGLEQAAAYALAKDKST